MAASPNLNKYETLQTVTITLAPGGTGIANGAGRISDVIDNTTIRADRGQVFWRITSGGSAPTAGAPYKLYLIPRSNGGTDLSADGFSTSDAAVSTEPTQAKCVGVITCAATTNSAHNGDMIVLRDLPPKFSLLFWNASGQAIHGTGSNHIVQLILLNTEAQ